MEVSLLINRALKHRRALLEDSETNGIRLVDGEVDGWPGVTLEQFAETWLVSTIENRFPIEFRHAVRDKAGSLYWKRLDQGQKEPPQWISGQRREAPFIMVEREGQRVLNTFSYTSAFSVAAAYGGAVTTSLDLSNSYLTWGKRKNWKDPN